VRGAQSNLDYLFEFVRNLPTSAVASESDAEWTAGYLNRFHEAVNNDLNTPQALAIVLDLVAEAYRRQDKRIWATLRACDQVLGLQLQEHLIEARAEQFPAEILRLRHERDQARSVRNFQRADELRRELNARGYEIQDGQAGSVLIPKRTTP
jgi:cysteinyl-tRNA synthetase